MATAILDCERCVIAGKNLRRTSRMRLCALERRKQRPMGDGTGMPRIQGVHGKVHGLACSTISQVAWASQAASCMGVSVLQGRGAACDYECMSQSTTLAHWFRVENACQTTRPVAKLLAATYFVSPNMATQVCESPRLHIALRFHYTGLSTRSHDHRAQQTRKLALPIARKCCLRGCRIRPSAPPPPHLGASLSQLCRWEQMQCLCHAAAVAA